ncbi:SWIM zinc finger family protein [Adhaeretor mobilis]|uniref:SWIM-type domain-containing protein n=1 Tax=Adhaeretor mobilis TaxID=1930276 RepID=A0A517MWF6_9BACT|nr:SWIM zinc finger family protein [Adhaeretor mobilis]QDS99213.1 hypothetical protein HG15A2_25050 [Adhaeretor mobilis]
MIEINEDFIDGEAPNSNAIKNGRGLLVKGKFVELHKSKDDTLIFGECSGSGQSNYVCSCDFLDPAKPVYRCSCPSRQFPCKHCLGLMYAYADGKKFKAAGIPEDIAEKRAKAQQRVQKRQEQATKPKKINKAALKKKIAAKLKGLDLLEQLTHDLVRAGMGNMNAKLARQIEDQAKQLGNAYLPGAQSALHNYTKLFVEDDWYFDAEISAKNRERVYSEAMAQLTQLNALVKQGRKYLSERLADAELAPEIDTPIAEWLGHAWQLSELKTAGLVESNVELIQLAFNSYDDVARREFVDTGVWMNLATGVIQLTQTFRPYKAVKYIKSEDSFFQVRQVPELCRYPGKVNPRVRWDAATTRQIDGKDLQAIRCHGQRTFAALVKQIKGDLKSPLANKRPIAALSYSQIATVGNKLVVEDTQGDRIAFTESGLSEEPPSCHLLWLLPKEMHKDQTLIARFHHDLDSHTLKVKPLSIITKSQIYRLTL